MATREFYLRKKFTVTAAQYAGGESAYMLHTASDDFSNVFIGGYHAQKETYISTKNTGGHEYEYWNIDVAVPEIEIVEGENVIAVRITNSENSSDLYLDLELDVKPGANAKVCEGCCAERGEGCLCGADLGFKCASGKGLECVAIASRKGEQYCQSTDAASRSIVATVLPLL